MGRRTATGLAAALLATALCLMGALGPAAVADDRPATWSAHAEASGVRVSVLKPAGLPTSDEIAGLSIPFARTETDSSPIGRAIASWLWPGEGIADVKSLLLVGLDPSAAQAEQEQRKNNHPGTDGCQPERALAVPEVVDPNTGEVLVPATPVTNPITGQPLYDPTDNPCGEAAARIALQTLVRERVPDYPFWAHSLWPPNRENDRHDEQTICTTTASFPTAWQLPKNNCPVDADAARTGFTEATSNEGGNWSTSQLTNVTVPGVMRAGAVTSIARTEWKRGSILASTSVTIADLSILGAGGAELIHVDALVAGATAASDTTKPVATLTASGVTVTLAGQRYEARIERGDVVVTDQRLPEQVRRQLTAALDLATASNRQRVAFGDADAEGAASAAAAGVRADPAAHAASVSALTVELGAADSLEGSSVVRFSVGVADARAITRASSGAFVPPPFPGYPGAFGGAPPVAPPAAFVPPSASGPQDRVAPYRAQVVAGSTIPASEPIPAGVVVAAMLAVILSAGGMVAAGIWETQG